MSKEEPKKTENETANNIVDINVEREDKVFISARLVFVKGTKLNKIIDDTKNFIDEVKKGKNNDEEGFT